PPAGPQHAQILVLCETPHRRKGPPPTSANISGIEVRQKSLDPSPCRGITATPCRVRTHATNWTRRSRRRDMGCSSIHALLPHRDQNTGWVTGTADRDLPAEASVRISQRRHGS